jgi:histone H3/H4
MSEILVVQSKVKEEIGKADMNCSGDLAEALSTVVEHKIKRAIERAKANGRKTVRPEDL